MKFLNKFYLFSGLSKLRSMQPKQQNTSEDFENLIVAEMRCEPEWPVCLYDFTYKNKCSSYFAYRVEQMPPLIEDYFLQREVKVDNFSTFIHFRRDAASEVPKGPSPMLLAEEEKT